MSTQPIGIASFEPASTVHPLVDAIANQEGFYKPGSRAQRNNNPGNVEYGDFAKSHGATGTDGRFAIFPDPDTGFKATQELLATHYGNMKLSDALAKYAPPSENNTAAYIKNVSNKIGVDPNAKVSDVLSGGSSPTLGIAKFEPEPSPVGTYLGNAAGKVVQNLNPIQLFQQAKEMLSHPVDTYNADSEQRSRFRQQALDAFHKGNYADAVAYETAGSVPFAGPLAGRAYGMATDPSADPAEAGNALGDVISLKATPAAYEAIPKVLSAVPPSLLRVAAKTVLGHGAGAVLDEAAGALTRWAADQAAKRTAANTAPAATVPTEPPPVAANVPPTPAPAFAGPVRPPLATPQPQPAPVAPGAVPEVAPAEPAPSPEPAPPARDYGAEAVARRQEDMAALKAAFAQMQAKSAETSLKASDAAQGVPAAVENVPVTSPVTPVTPVTGVPKLAAETPNAYLDTESTGLQVPQEASARANVAGNLATHLHESGITLDDLKRLEGRSQVEQDQFWKAAGNQPGVSKQANYQPSAKTIEAAKQALSDLEARAGKKSAVPANPPQESQSMRVLRSKGLIGTAHSLADLMNQ